MWYLVIFDIIDDKGIVTAVLSLAKNQVHIDFETIRALKFTTV